MDYKQIRKEVEETLNSQNEIEERDIIPNAESELTFENGIRSWVGALFVDMRGSTSFFKENKDSTVAKIIRAYFPKLIDILRGNDNVRDIGIRGDCVYGIYSVPKKTDIERLISMAATINSFNEMFQKILARRNYPTFGIGIGIGAGKDLIIKTGRKRTGINDYIWIGDAVINASNLSSLGNSEHGDNIYMDATVRLNAKKHKLTNGLTLDDILSREIYEGQQVFKCYLVNSAFDAWIKNNFED